MYALRGTFVLATLLMLQAATSVNAAFHVFTRYQRVADQECNKRTGVCYCKPVVEWRVGVVPSSQYNCDAFRDDKWFQRTWGNGQSWEGLSYPTICGSKPVDMYPRNGGLEIYEHNANPGKILAKCYRQSPNTIDCTKRFMCAGETKVNDVWVCADTQLC
ncbi:uncharacterized protein CTRU02_209454 [Colletotrichum truncatum]|uniref:Uncharacterized protein n=1 Tax=Colletotrichum truncatum TaxID=5467 RepID=A0ACC3YSF3_COLTU